MIDDFERSAITKIGLPLLLNISFSYFIFQSSFLGAYFPCEPQLDTVRIPSEFIVQKWKSVTFSAQHFRLQSLSTSTHYGGEP
jgi:hypothetical protein